MSPATQLVIIADDLSGAADTGAPFAQHGFTTTIALAAAPTVECDVLVLSTNSREGDAHTAAEANRAAVRQTLPRNPRRIYKKIDSALRGYPHAELHAVMAELGVTKTLVAPALPAEGRTTVGGRQFADGVPLEDTPFSEEGLTSDLIRLFDPDQQGTTVPLDLATIRQGSEAITRFLQEITTGIIVADAETAADLDLLAQAIIASDLYLVSGTAGLARSLAAALRLSAWADLAPTHQGLSSRELAAAPGLSVGADLVSARDARIPPILIVAGSRNRATSDQIAHLRQSGTPVVVLDQHHLDDPTASIDETIDALVTHLAIGTSTVLTTAGLGHSLLGSAFVVTRLAEIVHAVSTRTPLGGLVMTGGDVAGGVLTRMGATSIQLGGEIRPALPWGKVTFADGTSLPIATKAGSFGTEDALQACLAHLTSKVTLN